MIQRSRLRILHIVHQYLPDKVGGTELYTRTLARHQAALGHDVAVFTPSPSSNSAMPVLEDGVRIYRIPVANRSATAVFLSTFRQPQLNEAFRKCLRQENPQIIHIEHLMGLPVSLVSDIQTAQIPYLVTLHDYWHLCANAQLLTNYDETICDGPDWWFNCAHCALARSGHAKAYPVIPVLAPLFALRQAKLKSVLNQAHCLISPTQFTKTIHQEMGIDSKKIKVVGHGIQLPAVMPQPQTHDYFHMAYIGGISWQKGIHVLIDAVNQLPPEGIQLSIIGDMTDFPDYAAQLQAQATHPGIHFRGRLSHDQLWQALATIDVVVAPSLWYETASLIVQEAFAAKVPVIASNVGALKERVADGVNGRLVPPGNSDMLRVTLRSFLESPEQLADYRRNIQPVRSIENHMNDLEVIYQSIW